MAATSRDDAPRRLRLLRWTAFGLAAAAYVLSLFHRVAPAAIAGELRQAFQASGAQLGALAAAYFAVYMATQVPTGMLVDALGPRRILAAGGLVAGAGSLAFGLAGSLPVAAAGRGLVGLGVSVTFISALKLVAAWFREREFATYSGLLNFLGNAGAILAAAPLAWAVGLTSWRGLFAALGALSAVIGVLTAFLVRDGPQQAGPAPGTAAPGRRGPEAGRWYQGLWTVARNRATWPGFFVNFGLAGTYLTFVGLWAVPYLVEVHGLSRQAASLRTGAMLVAFAVFALLTGTFSDRLGRRKPPMIALGLVYVVCWIPWIVSVRLPAAASLALFALMGASATAFTVSWASAKELNPPALAGTAIAVVNTGVFLGPTVDQPLVGWVVDRARAAGDPPAEAYRLGLGVLAALALLGLVAALLVRETHCRNVAGELDPPGP
jgi:sugar phosphate permease